MKRAIKLGLRFIRDEQDWTGNSSPKISLRKTKVVTKAAGIDLDQTTEEKLSSVASDKRQRTDEQERSEKSIYLSDIL